jgi:hypothetical protein
MVVLPRTTEHRTLKKIVVLSTEYVVFIICEIAQEKSNFI